MIDMKLILASSSPRRRDLLIQAGLTFEVVPPRLDEAQYPNEPPMQYVERLALAKARAIAAFHPTCHVLGADTTVVLGGNILNKPADRTEAAIMLRELSGNTHQVHTAIAVATGTSYRTHIETTDVFFADIPEVELAVYLATGDSLDKAGAYGIQGYAARWINRIEGDFYNVVGLPIAATIRLLNSL